MTTKSSAAIAKKLYNNWTVVTQLPPATRTASNFIYSSLMGGFSLTYDRGPKHNADGSPFWKNCDHIKDSDTTYSPYVFSVSHPSLQCWGSLNGYANTLLCGSGSYLVKMLPYQALPSIATTYNDHLNEIYGQVKPCMLGIENLAGLFSGKSLYRSAEVGIRALLRTVVNGNKTSFKDAVKAFMGLDLAIQFSVKATISDIEQSLSLFEGWTNHIKKLRERQGSGVLMYKTSKSNQDSDEQLHTWGWSNGGELPQYAMPQSLQFEETRKASSTTTLFTRAKVRYSEDTLSVINYMQGALGLNRPLSSIWAIIPLSFLLDYVVSIQTLCDELDSQLNRDTAVQSMLLVDQTWVTQVTKSTSTCTLPKGVCGYSPYWGSHEQVVVERTRSVFSRHPLSLGSVYSGWSAVGQVTPRKAATVAEIAFQIFA